jgi:integrase
MRLALKWEEAARGARRKTFTAAQAHRVLSECVAISTGEKLETYTLRTWLEEWLKSKHGATAERTLIKYTADLNTFVESLGGRADITLGAIEPGDIRRWRDARRKSGLSVTTCNLAVKVLKGAFARAVALGYIPTNPCAAVDRLKDDAAATRDVFSTEQVNALVNAAEGDWRGVILCGFFTGLRMRDITDMIWERVDLSKGLLKVPTTKTGVVVTVPLHPELMKWLKSRERGIGKAPVFPSLFQKSGAGKSG